MAIAVVRYFLWVSMIQMHICQIPCFATAWKAAVQKGIPPPLKLKLGFNLATAYSYSTKLCVWRMYLELS